jgi:hypothetical protein
MKKNGKKIIKKMWLWLRSATRFIAAVERSRKVGEKIDIGFFNSVLDFARTDTFIDYLKINKKDTNKLHLN